MKDKKGIILVYTGKGKGKTTAALGLALRAIGHGAQVFMVQFRKSNPNYGEIQAIRNYLPAFTFFQAGKSKMYEGYLKEDERQITVDGFLLGKEALLSEKFDLVIFDELNIVLDKGLLAKEEVLEMLAKRPPWVDIVLTGRNAPPEIIEAADMASEIKEIKHHYKTGTKARAGMEF